LVSPDNWAVSMHKKLALLCEKQLNAILLESDMAFKDIINAATASMRHVEEMNPDSRSYRNTGTPAHSNQVQPIRDELQKMLVLMQFHDAFSQRLHHVIELCQLIAEHDAVMPGSEQLENSLLERVIEIFSVSAEFTVLETIFPEYQHERPGVAVELF
jgi:hypothetical protein